MNKKTKYQDVTRTIAALVEGETDTISVMSTLVCELFHSFDEFNWVGFYRRVDNDSLKVGPYQGTHGCLTIQINKGVCGKCVTENRLQLENDVSNIPHHIACSSDTRSEIVLPIRDKKNQVVAVLDIDSVMINCFDEIDIYYLEKICQFVEKVVKQPGEL